MALITIKFLPEHYSPSLLELIYFILRLNKFYEKTIRSKYSK